MDPGRATDRSGRGRGLGRAVLLLAVLGVLPGCTQAVSGVAVPAPDPAGPTADSRTPAEPRPRGGLAADVLTDECLLDREQAAALVGRPVQEPRQREVRRDDGSTASGCYVDSSDAYPRSLLAVNVYRPRAGTAAAHVGSARGGRELAGVGQAAVLLDTATGPVLQLAGTHHLVTVAVLDGTPSAQAWRDAAQAALDALPDG